uniref:Uncharacterized protein n=1 Tax=Noctiluca scintillans TaxID=2966 RepID=A0A7S1A402_NOCSC|mmetsp:Transcript_29814/g.79263  ORF Transcript_29814/g.79263 Transcript_29814/m.79263 type:complete len:451 (+) Transcript_29814:142-1494(+)
MRESTCVWLGEELDCIFLGEEFDPIEDPKEEDIIGFPLKAVLDVMEQHVKQGGVQVAGCIALSNFALHPSSKLCSDSIRALRRAITEHPKNVLVQRLACKTLKTISDVQNHSSIEKLLSVEVVQRVLKEHAEDAETVKWCCGLLRNLTLHHSTRQSNAVTCITSSLSAMSKFPDNEELQLWCLGALNHLALSNAGCQEILSQNGTSCVRRAMRLFPDGELQGLGRKLLLRLAINDSAGGQVAVMHARLKDVRAQRNGCRVLASLGDPVRRRVVELGAIRVVKSALRAHSRDYHVLLWGCRALDNLAFDSETREEVGDPDGVRLVHAGMWAFPKDLELQRSGLSALSNLALSRDVSKRIGDLNGVEVVHGAMVAFRTDTSVQTTGLSALSLLMQSDDALMRMKYLEGETVVQEAMRHLHDHTSRAVGQKTMGKLTAMQGPKVSRSSSKWFR